MMNDFSELYKRIEYLRNNGTKMKEIADWVGMAPSVLSSLYTTVLPAYFDSAKQCRRKRRSTRHYRWLITYPKENCFQDWKTR